MTNVIDQASGVLARLERLPRRAVRHAVTGMVGIGLFAIFFTNFDINVSFIQTCVQVRAGCTAHTAQHWLTLPVCLYLVGYSIGGLLLAPVSDRIGRRRILLITLSFAAVGSLLTALAGDYTVFVLGRAVTGVCMGSTLAASNTYIGEYAPAGARARYTSITFVCCALGAMFGIGLGLLLTTAPAAFPKGLPVALAGPGFADGWRWLYGLGALVAAVAIAVLSRLPESPRWLIEHGRVADADRVVSTLEQRALRRGPLPEPASAAELPGPESHQRRYRELFASPRYRRRLALLIAMWFTGYATVIGYASGSTVILTSLHFTAPVAGMISAVGGLGFFVQGLFSAKFSERVERRYWLPVGAALCVLGGVVIALFGAHILWAFVGSFVLFFGFNVWVPPTFALSAESFPTRVRAAGFGLVEGTGILGGIMGVLVIAPLVPKMTPLPALLMISGFLVVAAVLAQFTPRARNRHLEELSP